MSDKITWPTEYEQAGRLLAKAAGFAEYHQCSAWDFAVELSEFRELGLSRCELRHLVRLGFLEHSEEIPTISTDERCFRTTGKLTFADRTCFILSRLGRTAVADLTPIKSPKVGDGERPAATDCPRREDNGSRRPIPPIVVPKPVWDPKLRSLTYEGLLVKRYRAYALNQHLILTAFQEENWPERIDDPLPPINGIEPKRRLYDAIVGLNRTQANRLLNFLKDGLGRGIHWLPVMGTQR